MIHQYKLGGHNIVLDVCSGSIHEVDDAAYDMIALYESAPRRAVIASVAAETSILLAFIFFSRDYIRLSWILKASVRYLIAGAAMAGAIALSRRWLNMSWKNLAIQVAGGGIIYAVTILLLRDAFALEMLAIIRRNLPFGKRGAGKGT